MFFAVYLAVRKRLVLVRPWSCSVSIGAMLRATIPFFLTVSALIASTNFLTTWKNPKAGLLDLDGRRFAAFVVTADETMRLGPEETLAAEMRRRGFDCVAGYTVLPGELARDEEKAKTFLENAGITGAIMLRVLRNETEVRYTPATAYYSTGYYPSFWGYWNYGWSVVYTPGYQTSERIVSIETLFYLIDKDQLVWAGKSETANPKEIRKFVKELVEAAGKAMRRDGLARK